MKKGKARVKKIRFYCTITKLDCHPYIDCDSCWISKHKSQKENENATENQI